jgi:Uma2 family endonuclease
MLDENALRLLPTEEDLPDSDGKPVDNELQLLAPMLLRGILSYLWDDRADWFFAVNLGLYHDPYQPAIGPDAFLSLGVERVRANNELRLSYLVYREKVMPHWVLEVVSREPGGEYGEKLQRYADLGVLYYVIYNPSHYRRDKHEPFEVYKLEQGKYRRQPGNPVWMPEIGLGIGHELGTHDKVKRDWLYWYDEQGSRYPAPDDVLKQERILREREQLMRRELEEQLEIEARSRQQAEQALAAEARSRQQAEQALAQEKQAIALNLLQENIPLETIARTTGLAIAQLQHLQAENQ